MKIDGDIYRRMPKELQDLFEKDYDEVEEEFAKYGNKTGCKPHRIKSNIESYEGWGSISKKDEIAGFNDSGTASRFFYSAKASKKDRNEGCEDLPEKDIGHNRFDKCKKCGGIIFQNPDRPSACKCENPERENNIVKGNNHPTVKPTELMQYLCRLVTPKGGTVLDPFMGSGSTGKGAIYEGFNFIGIEKEEEYMEIAKRRIEFAQKDKEKSEQPKTTFNKFIE